MDLFSPSLTPKKNYHWQGRFNEVSIETYYPGLSEGVTQGPGDSGAGFDPDSLNTSDTLILILILILNTISCVRADTGWPSLDESKLFSH